MRNSGQVAAKRLNNPCLPLRNWTVASKGIWLVQKMAGFEKFQLWIWKGVRVFCFQFTAGWVSRFFQQSWCINQGLTVSRKFLIFWQVVSFSFCKGGYGRKLLVYTESPIVSVSCFVCFLSCKEMAALQVCVQRITNDWCILFCVSFGDTVAAPFTAMISTPDCGIDTGGHSMSRSISPQKKPWSLA